MTSNHGDGMGFVAHEPALQTYDEMRARYGLPVEPVEPVVQISTSILERTQPLRPVEMFPESEAADWAALRGEYDCRG